LVKIIQKSRLKFTTVPSLDQLATGKVLSQLREVNIEDLLGRETVELEKHTIRGYLENRVVMVTGAGGSIGQELCRQIADFQPLQILLVEQCEVQLFQIEQELIELGHGPIIQPLIADILDRPRMEQIFNQFCPSVVFHAAAHKHVPMMERQPVEAIKNNTLGSAQLAEMASEHGIERFVMISTDKAINPTNVMGATKRLAELFVQALQNSGSNCTKFMAVRFGNVLGSSGSVIPTFKRQIAAGGPVKVTHPEVTRFFMTIPEAVGLVLQSGAQGLGGEIFILDMGQPIKVADLARQLIELSGLRPDEDIAIQYVGLRPGEKLYEELRHHAEDLAPTQHPKILRLQSEPLSFEKIQKRLRELQGCLHTLPANELKILLKQEIPEYQPQLSLPVEADAPEMPARGRTPARRAELAHAEAHS
jgi:FlaA1/EpsC-like NDP-sugar epimerase